MSQLSSLLDAATTAALQSGNILLNYYGNVQDIQNKNFAGDLVTEADIASEKALFDYIKKNFPDHGILGEESGAINVESPWQWVVDPLDGTTNFAHKHPMFCVSIGILYENRPVVGVIYNPLYKELFSAAEGLGATLNKTPIHVSKISSLDKSILATGFPYDRKQVKDNNYKEFCLLTHLTQGVRRAGSAALDLAYTAAGRLEGYWEKGIKPWDIAAGIIIVREAGGTITRYDGSPIDGVNEERILATNGHIHHELSQTLCECKEKASLHDA